MTIPSTRMERAAWFARKGGLDAALDGHRFEEPVTLPLTEALVLGLLRQGVSKYLVIFGHGSTELGETLRVYEAAGLVRCYQLRNEVEMAHAGTALRLIYGEPCAVVTSIGPGALQALAGSLAAASNGVGIYHLYGDETTHGEGYNMQQIPRPEQGLFGRLTAAMGSTYTLYAPGALRDALRKGAAVVFHPTRAGPFFLNLPLNVQPAEAVVRLDSLPSRPQFSPLMPVDTTVADRAAALISNCSRVAIKAGGGCLGAARQLRRFAEAAGAAVVLSPGTTGVLPDAHPQNMHVGGSKGSISGNFAMREAELAIFVGSRAVCQSDCSGTGWPNARNVININADVGDVQHYNRTLALQGDAAAVLDLLSGRLGPTNAGKADWLAECDSRKAEWQRFKRERFDADPLYDEVWQRPVLTQPQAIHVADRFANRIGAIKLFDAGDVQANGFQIVEDTFPGQSVTESGASYMGFAVSALLSSAFADTGRYAIAFTGDGSFMMNPQILIDGVEHGVHGTILLLDNRRMAAISGLQHAQYRAEFRTNDAVTVDYVRMASSVKGILALSGGYDQESLGTALVRSHAHRGLSLIHVPVYYGRDPLGGMGAYGDWNVGNWCEEVQRRYSETLI